MEMNEKGKDLAKKLISGYVSPEIAECRKVADFWTMIVTGQNQDNVIKAYRYKETEHQQEQACKFYDTRTRYVAQKVKSIFKKGDRTDGIIDTMKYKTDQRDKLIEIRNNLHSFHANKHIDRWINKRYRNDQFKDPNTVYLLKFSSFNPLTEKPKVYPVKYGSHNQIERNYQNGSMVNVTFIESMDVITEDGIDTTPKVIYYEPDRSITAYEVTDESLIKPSEYNKEFSLGYYLDVDDKGKPRRVFVEEFLTKSKRLPAFCIGYVECEESDYDNVFDSPMYAAKDIFKELIKKKSKYDVHIALHGILQKFAYVPRCKYANKKTGLSCRGGLLTNGSTCPKCDGTGKVKFHQSEQDIVTIEMPGDIKEEMFDLAKLIHYETVDTNLIQLHKDEVDELQRTVSLAIFNTNMFERKELASGTATEIRANLTYVNNEIYDYKTNQADLWTFLVYQTAIYLDNDEGFSASRKVPVDYKLETVSDLIAMRSSAITAGAPYDIVRSFDLQILSKQNAGNPEIVERIAARDSWKPFSDKTETERVSIITLLPDDHPQKILYINFQEIFNEIENARVLIVDEKETGTPFYKLPWEKQKDIINQMINKYKPVPATEPTIRDAE